jgi:hypothetical protein
MNALNALAFAALGSVMEILPKMFPSWFPPTGSDQWSTRAVWLGLMGAVQITLGVGFIVRAHVVPFLFSIVSSAPAAETGTLALPNPRGVNAR